MCCKIENTIGTFFIFPLDGCITSYLLTMWGTMKAGCRVLTCRCVSQLDLSCYMYKSRISIWLPVQPLAWTFRPGISRSKACRPEQDCGRCSRADQVPGSRTEMQPLGTGGNPRTRAILNQLWMHFKTFAFYFQCLRSPDACPHSTEFHACFEAVSQMTDGECEEG